MTHTKHWKERIEHEPAFNLLRETDPIYGEENRRAKQDIVFLFKDS